MSTVQKFRPAAMSPIEAATVAIEAADRLDSLDEKGIFIPDTLRNIHHAVDRRQRDGFITDPTSRVEVSGLVRAALGDYAHMEALPQVKTSLKEYAASFLQTDTATMELVRDELRGETPITDIG